MGGSGNQRCFPRNNHGLAAMRHTLPTLFGYLISRRLPLCGLPAASVAINAAFPREGSPALVQSGAAPGAVPSVSAEWHALFDLLRLQFGCIPERRLSHRRRLVWSEKSCLCLGWSDLRGRRTLCVIIRNGIDPTADGIAPHHPGVIWLEHVGHCSHVVHSRIEPQIITVWIEDDRHSIMDGRGHSIRSRGQDRARLDPLLIRVFPAIP